MGEKNPSQFFCERNHTNESLIETLKLFKEAKQIQKWIVE